MKKIIFILFITGQLLAQSVNLPLNHWGYDFLSRMQAKNMFSSLELRTKPVPRIQVAKIVQQVYTEAFADPEKLSKAEWGLLTQLMSDVGDELYQLGFAENIAPERHLAQLHEEQADVYFDLHGRETIHMNRGGQFDPDELLSETAYGGQFRGILGEKIGLYAEATNYVTRGEETQEEQFGADGEPIVTSGKNVIRDRATGYFVWQAPWLRLQAGRDDLEWGPARHQGVTLSRNMPPADALRMDIRFKKFKFTSVHAWLRSDLGQKYLAAHRLDWQVLRGLAIGGGETVIYAGRNVEPTYLNPLMFYHVAEHHLGDLDNNALFVDATLTSIPNATLYFEWFIDDMTSTESWTDYFGNKFAFTLGGFWVDALSVPNLDLSVEYNRISPYVYSHRDSISIYTSYDKILGHPMGPNGDLVYTELAYRFHRDFKINTFYEFRRKGVGAADTNSIPKDIKKNFLKGVVEERQTLGIRLVDQLFRDIYIGLSYAYSDTRNLAQQKDKKSYDHQARFECWFNF